jgi:hypothetical protein
MSGTDGQPPQTTQGSLEALIAATASNATQSKVLVQSTDSATDADRSRIARQIINVFVGALLLVLIMLVIQGYMANSWPAAVSQATDLLKTTLLPIVTLVLGYYFGQSGKG